MTKRALAKLNSSIWHFDPGETNNQADQFPDRVQQLLSKLDEVAARDRDAVAE